MNRDFIERVREAVDIVEYIGRYVDLKRSGKSYKGLCPFHQEKTPSFYVDPDKGVYHCFGCGASGNIFRFVMDIEGLSFREAVIKLAREYGIEIPTRESEEKLSPVYAALKFASDFYHELLFSSQGRDAYRYLMRRKITSQAIASFKLGYAPPDGKSFVNKALSKNFDRGTLIQAGLVRKTETGSIVDYFRGRLIFPIFTPGGNVIAFGGRALSDEVQPKYLNSPDSEVFKKGSILFGLYQAKSSIRMKGYVIVVEGYFDVIKMHQAGFQNTVAPMGTALTENQALVLKRYTKNVLLLYDGDDAGRKAVNRSIPVLLKTGLNVKVSLLPEGEDPDSIIDKFGAAGIKSFIDRQIDFLDYQFKEAEKLKETPAEYSEAIKRILENIFLIPDGITRDAYLNRLSELSQIPVSSLRDQGLKFSGETGINKKSKKGEVKLTADFIILVNILRHRDLAEIVGDIFEEADFDDPLTRELFRNIKQGLGYEEIMAAGSDILRASITEALMRSGNLHENLALLEEKIRFWKYRKDYRTAKRSFEEAKREGDREKMDFYLKQMFEIKKKLRGKGGLF